MIITLVKANFSTNNIGTLNSFAVLTNLLNATYNGPTNVTKGEPLTATIEIQSEYVLESISVLMGGQMLSNAYSITGNTIMINIDAVNGIVVINANCSIKSELDAVVTWELGAINSGTGPNSTEMAKTRIRTAGYLQVENSITIKAIGNVEFCPIYYTANKTYISSPNAYQTTDCVVNASDYPLVRLMIRDKTSTTKDLTSSLTELGNSVVITGNFVEIPYDGTSSGGTTGGGTSGTTGATGIWEGATWKSGAIDSTSGNGSVTMNTRIHTGFIPLGNVTVSVSGDAEFCPFLYNADKTYIKPSTTPAYQKTTQTWTSADGAYLVIMARNSTATTTPIDPSYGANVNIQIN